MLPKMVRIYALRALAGTPDVLEELLEDVAPDAPIWDARPDPERFTLREIVAHLADWEPIHRERVQRMRTETQPTMDDIDEGAMVLANDYAHQDPIANLARFRAGRAALMQTLETIADDEWGRKGERPPTIGLIALDEMATFILSHDGYHTKQVAQWLNA